MEPMNDRYSIKNLLFTKAIPNYVIPVPTAGYKVFACLDCGDKFMLESSLQYHVTRKSLKISYLCRLCNKANVFYNRCNLLAHIRGHTFKTATINITDLKIEPLPLNFFKKTVKNYNKISANEKEQNNCNNIKSITTSVSSRSVEASSVASCYECKANIPGDGVLTKVAKLPKERVNHYMKVTNETFSCPVCLFKLPTKCAYKAHLRFHFSIPPFVCPECGFIIKCAKSTVPFSFENHSCEGFQMMRRAARIKCPVPDCHLLTLSEYKEHLKSAHLKEIFKCSDCYFACIDEPIIKKHITMHHTGANVSPFYQCQICHGKRKLVPHEQVNDHLKAHMRCVFMYPCWICGVVFDRIVLLVEHQSSVHDTPKEYIECFEGLRNLSNNSDETRSNEILNSKKMYGVVKRCDQCLRSFSYRCRYEQIANLPNECPYKCSALTGSADKTEQQIKCHICKNKLSQNWDNIKKHYNEYHKSHRCLDIQVAVSRINIEKYLKNTNGKTTKNSIKKRTSRRKRIKRIQVELKPDPQEPTNAKTYNEFACRKCGQEYENKEILEQHLLVHKDLYMAYQCMECGQSFVVKPSFSKHLLLEHNISNVEEYISEKKCYNEDALQKYQDQPTVNEPLLENQCKICRLQLDNSDDLEKHFRVHGMAFLMKNNSTKITL